MNDALDLVIFDTKLKAERDYWLKRLASVPTASTLLPHYYEAHTDLGNEAVVELVVPGELSSKVCALAGASHFLLYTILMSALKVCFHKYTNDHLITVGSPPLKELGKPNTLAVASRLNSEMLFKDLLLQVRRNLLDAYANQRYPFGRLLKDLRLESNGGCPLFETALSLENIHGPLAETKHNIGLTFTYGVNNLTGYLSFKQDIYDRESMERFGKHFLTILQTGVEETRRPLREFELLTESERKELLYGWNRTEKDCDSEACIHELFQVQVKRSPESIALKFADEELTYDELNRKANKLAHHLRTLGVKAEVLVGVHVERSLEMMIALLAILKAGGAYVPLDSTYPKERLAFMLENAGLKILLTQQRLVEHLPDGQAKVVLLDSCWQNLADESEQDLDIDVNSDNLAYVIYTSGSTGTPKGVMISHKSLVNYLSWATNTYRVTEGKGAPVHSPLGFDLTVTSLFTPLMAGKSVVLLREEQGVEGLLTALRGDDFSLVKLTPAHLEVLERLPQAEEAARRARTFVIGGEALYGETLSFWRSHRAKVRLINEYGPTETVVGCCVYEVPFGNPIEKAVPIGKPIDNTQLYVLDPHLKPLPPGIVGELYIGGVGLARGYLGQPAQTAEWFLPDPFGSRSGARLYRTGDLVRAQPDGTLEFIDRRDRQVKVRGYRIELGEVEAALKNLTEVREAVVGLVAAERGGGKLVAYVVAGEALNSEQIRARLQAQLPAYMVPGQVVLLERLPLTKHGKVDEGALQALAERLSPDGRAAEDVTPLSETEQAVAEIWSAVLGVGALGRQANFFDLGGHSLLATQVTTRVRERLHIEIPLQRLFDSPTMAEFARRIEEAAQTSQPAANPIKPISRDGQLPLSFAQQRFWYLDRLHPENPSYNSCALLRVNGSLNVPALEQAFNEIISRHEILRTVFPEVEGGPTQVILPEQPVTLLLADLTVMRNIEAQAAERLTNAEAQRSFDLSSGPLIRASVRLIDEREYVVQVTMHHIITDNWSNDLFYKELVSLYSSYTEGQPSTLSNLPIQYVDFANWQREQLNSTSLSAQRTYWQQQLADPPPPVSLSDRPLPLHSQRIARTHYFYLAASMAERLRQFTRDTGVTFFAALMAGFAALLHFYTGAEDIIIGTPVSNRNRKEAEGLIGCLINTLALRVKLLGNPSFAELTRRVQAVLLAALAHQEVPFEVVAESLPVSGTARQRALFRHWFALQQGVGTLMTGGAGELELEMEEVSNAGAQFELTLLVRETAKGLRCALVHVIGEIGSKEAQALAADYGAILAAGLDQPETRILELRWTEQIADETVAQGISV